MEHLSSPIKHVRVKKPDTERQQPRKTGHIQKETRWRIKRHAHEQNHELVPFFSFPSSLESFSFPVRLRRTPDASFRKDGCACFAAFAPLFSTISLCLCSPTSGVPAYLNTRGASELVPAGDISELTASGAEEVGAWARGSR